MPDLRSGLDPTTASKFAPGMGVRFLLRGRERQADRKATIEVPAHDRRRQPALKNGEVADGQRVSEGGLAATQTHPSTHDVEGREHEHQEDRRHWEHVGSIGIPAVSAVSRRCASPSRRGTVTSASKGTRRENRSAKASGQLQTD